MGKMSRIELFQTVLKSHEARIIVMRELYSSSDFGVGLSLTTDYDLFRAVKACQKKGLILNSHQHISKPLLN